MVKSAKKIYLAVLIFGIILGLYLHELLPKKPAVAKVVTIQSRNLHFKVETHDETVSQGITIDVSEPVKVILVDAGNEREIETLAATVNDLLYEQKIGLAATDQISPPLGGFLGEGLRISIDRIVDLEITETSEIPYEIKLEYDPEVFYGQEAIVEAGIPGKKEQTFLITYKNGVEIRRRLLEEKILERPKIELRKFGTKIEVEETREGRASWYATKKCLSPVGGCAAHPFYSLGRYVRVTSLSSDKTIIVQINDRGPDLSVHPDRVIDLDSTAFKALAPLGTGTIAVKVELLK